MANKKNVEANKKNTEIKNKKSNELEQKKPTNKKKLRLHSHLKVNIPLFQSLMMILPSLAKHAAAEDVDNSGDTTDQLTANNVTAKDSSDHHGNTDSSGVTHPEAQTSDSDVNSTLSASHAPHGSSSHLVPSHHLSTLSHPQVHYIPSVSMPTISSGSNGQPTHSNAPTTPALPVTFMPEVIKGTYGELHVDANGQYTFVLNPKSPQYILLNQHQQGTDHFLLHLSNGSSVIVQVPVTGKQDTPIISGDLTGVVTEDHNIDSQGLLHANGKIDVIDPDQNESSVKPEVISGKYGSLTIDSDGHWQYQVDNSLSNVQALTGATSLHESFTIHTKDGTPQTIDMTIGGNDDNAVITGVDAGTLTEDLTTQVQGQLSVTDSDLGEDHFQASQVTSNFGTLSITKDGAWTYNLDNNNLVVQGLGQGSTATDIVTVHSADGTAHQVTVTINGTNDKAVIGGTDSGTVTEESQLQTSGTLTVTDVDTGEAHFSYTDIVGSFGTLHLTDSGSWTYDLDNTNPTVQALGANKTATDTITVHSADGTTHQVTITINGTNDKAIIGGTSSGAVTEESQLQTSGTLTVTDIDTGEAHFSNTDIAGRLGTLHLTDSGAWTYDLDNTNPAVQALGANKTATDTITVHSADGTTHQVTITINGTNDKAIIGGTSSGAVTEESQLQTSGTLTVTDVDTGEAHFSNTDVAGTLGTLHLTDSGAWTYDLDNTNPTVQALGAHKTATDTITVHSADGTTHQVTITINGTNDKAIIGGTSSGSVTEESQLQTSGTLTVTDVDTGEAHFSNTDIVGNLGTLHLTDSGAWTYDLDNTAPNVQALGAHKTATDTITVHSADGTPHQVTITVNGTNDKAVIGGTSSGAVTEESKLQTSGKLTVTDIDTGEAHFSNTDIAGSFGKLHLTDSGAWTYDLDNANPAVQALGKGVTATDTITIHSADGTSHQVTITVNGTNDAAVIGGTNSGAVTEESQLQTSGTLTVTDIDTGEAHFSNSDIAGRLGTLHLTDSGAWTYDLDNTNPTVQALGKGATATDTITVHSADGTSHQVTITVNGTNDAAVIMGTSTGDVHEGHTFTARDGSMTGSYVDDRSPDHQHGNIGKLWNDEIHTDGHLSIVDADAGESYAQTGTYYGTHGRVILQTNGDWTYYASIGQDATGRAIDHLGKGESLTDTVTVKSTDGTTHDIVVTIHGDNDSPYCSSEVQLNSGKEDLAQTITASELLANTIDVDTNDIGKLTIANLHADHGSIQDNKDGTYTFTPTKDYNGQVHFTYDVQDAHGGVTHTGATTSLSAVGDTAIIGGQDTFAVQEDHNLTLNSGNTIIYNGQLTITDADAGEDHFDGNLHQNQQTGTWDTGYTTQEGGKLILQSNGSYRYEIDNSLAKIQSLGSSETLIDTVTVRSADGTPHQIQVTIQGDNDAPVVSSAVTLTAGTEDTDVVLHASDLLANATDIDHDDAGKLSVANLIADHGTITDNHDGTFTFHPTQDYNGKVSFTYDVQDAHGGSVATSASITLAPTRDSAVITGTDTGKIIEDHNVGPSSLHPVAASGLLSVTDPDAGQDHFQVNLLLGEQAIHDPFGGYLRITPNGAWGYAVANSRLQSLAEGEVEKVVYRVYSADHTAHDITITVTGTNDQPTITAKTLAHGTEDTHYQMQASQFGFTDIDTGDTLHSIAITDLPPATQGKFVLDGHDVTTGQQIPTADISKLQFVPAQDFNGDVQFKYTVNDGHTDSTEATNTLHFDAVGDAAVITGTTTGDVDEGHGTYRDRSPNYAQPGMGKLTNDPLYTDGKLEIIDPDAGEGQFDTKGGGYSYHGTYGQLILNADGNWHYKVIVGSNQQNVATQIDQLGDGQQLTDTITVYSKDGTTHDIVITIHGDNDRPYCSSEVQLNSGKEDLAQTITATELLANTIDVDSNDLGKLTIENLLVDHGSVVDNKDGTYTFTPTKDYNGLVHFTYDVTDAHGGTTHTGANTSLAAVNDAATFAGDSSSIKEDTNIHHNAHITGSATIPDALSCHGHLIVSDADGHGEAALDLKGQPKISLDGTYGHFDITSTGTWVYKADNKSTPIQDLDNGQTLTDSIEVTSKDGTKHSITVTINGTTDDPVLHSLSDSGVQHSGPVEGNLLTGSGTDQGLSGAATDTDSNAHLVLQDIQIKDPVSGYVAVRPGQPHTMAGIGTLAIEANGHYTFTPEAGFTGKVPSMVYRVGDDGGNPIGDSSQNSLSIEVTPPLQHAPTVTGQTVSTNEDITRTFTTSEFGYSDQDGDALQFVTISNIPSHGLLLLNGKAVTANQQITKADLDAGHLTFTPISNENGANYAQFTFTANDGHQDSASATMIVDVNAVNDAPIVGSSFISSLEDKPHAFTTADFKYSDIDGDALNHITITNVAHGVLSLNGTTVNVGDDVSASDVSSLIFTPTHNYFSSGVSGLGAVQFTANDGHLDSKEGSILINIASVADPATFSGDSTGVAKEDITLQASGTLTASDPDGTAGVTAVQGGAGIAGSKGYGHAHIDVNGHWTYDLDNNHPIVQQLGEGQTDTETITVQSADGTHHDIVVTITGTNDAPILGVNQTSSTTGTLTETDVDVKDTHTFSVVSSTGQFGALSVDPNTGDYVYTPNTSITGMSYNSATNTYHGVDVFEVKVSDGHTEDSKFITFDASGHVTTSPTGGLVISTTVPQQPAITATQPTLSSGTNVAPTNTVTLDLASTSDSGSSNTDNLTNDTTPTITGHTDIPFSKVTIYDGSTPVGHGVSDASGQYSVAVSSLSEGDHNLSAKALAPSSVVPATSSLLSVHIDTQVHVGIQTDPITADNVINAQESNSSIDISGSVSGDFNAGDIVTLDVNGTQHTGVVDAKGHYSIAVPGSELIADADQKIEASVAVTDSAGNSAHATVDVTYQVDTQVSVPTITFENAGADNLYSKAEIARGQANTITATVTPPSDAKIGEHLVVNGQDHVLDAHTLQHGIQIEVHPGSNVQATMTDEHGNTAGSQGFAASAIPEPIIVRPPSGSHQVSGTLGVPPLLPSLTPVPTAQSGWRIHLPNGQYVTSHHGQYGTLTIDPQTGHLHYQEQAQVHTGPHGSASGIGQHEDKFEVALQGTNQDEVVAHVNIQILSHGPGHSGKLTVGTEVVDMTITPLVHTSHPAPPPPPPVQHDEPDMASQADFTVTLSDDSNLDLTQQTHQEPDQKTSHHGAAAYLDALGIKPDATSTAVHDQPADMDIVLAQVDQPDAVTHDQAHLDMSDALEHHDANINHNQDDEHHHHNDVDGLPDIDPNS
ncbi:VCBS domain-containing protein [Vibrio coralliirubri]|uniref:VCBS domain-containing protein n=1 Tax=Vibrio coralliirubri TaxID=1516159 RepID=UPI002FE2B7FD